MKIELYNTELPMTKEEKPNEIALTISA